MHAKQGNPSRLQCPMERPICPQRGPRTTKTLEWTRLGGRDKVRRPGAERRTMEWTMHAKQGNPSRIQAQGKDNSLLRGSRTAASKPLKRPAMQNPGGGQRYSSQTWCGTANHGVDDACETRKPQQDSSPTSQRQTARQRPNVPFERLKIL